MITIVFVYLHYVSHMDCHGNIVVFMHIVQKTLDRKSRD
jgi:hypothetical protein